MEEGKSQKVVETYKAVAAGIASVLAAVFTSKLGVAGTLIGTAMAAVLITLGSALFKVQMMKASNKISGLPGTVRGRLSTQQIRMPGKQNTEPNPEPAAQPETADGRSPGLLSRLRTTFSRLRAMPGFLKDLPPNQRRKTLVAGLLAGLLAMAIGLAGVTGIELAGGKNLSCLVWSSCPDDDKSGGASGRAGLSILGGYSGTGGTPSVDPPGVQPSVPVSDQQVPEGPGQEPVQQPGDGAPSQPDVNSGEPRQQPGQPPRGEDPAQPGSGSSGVDKEAETPASGKAPEEGRIQSPGERGSKGGQEKEDRG